jgi:hypothetical protein
MPATAGESSHGNRQATNAAPAGRRWSKAVPNLNCPECLKYGVAVWCWEGGGWQIKCNLCGGEVWDAQTDN